MSACYSPSLARGRGRTGDETLEEGLVLQILVVLLEVLLGWSDELDGSELVASLFKSADDLADETTLNLSSASIDSFPMLLVAYLNAIRLHGDEAVRPSIPLTAVL
jgi:hypothetical protein